MWKRKCAWVGKSSTGPLRAVIMQWYDVVTQVCPVSARVLLPSWVELSLKAPCLAPFPYLVLSFFSAWGRGLEWRSVCVLPRTRGCMCVCVWLYVHACVCPRARIGVCVSVCACMCVCTHAHECVYVCLCACVRVCVLGCVNKFTCVCVSVSLRMCLCISTWLCVPQDNLVSTLVPFLRCFLPCQGSSMSHWPKVHPQAPLTDHRASGNHLSSPSQN